MEPPAPSFISSESYSVDPWTNALEDEIISAQVFADAHGIPNFYFFSKNLLFHIRM